MLSACVASWQRTYTKPTTGCGTYGCSREVISSVESFTFTDARASSRWCDRSSDDRLRKQPRQRYLHLQFVESESTPVQSRGRLFAYFHAARAYLEAWGKPV